MFFTEGVQTEDAVSSFSRLLDLAPSNGLGHLGLGTKALQEGRYKDAIKDLAQGWFLHQQRMDSVLNVNAPEYFIKRHINHEYLNLHTIFA